MSPDDPRHGTPRQLWRTAPGCMCETCEKARTLNRRSYKNRDRGIMQRVPTAPVVRHINRLIAKGWTQKAIADASGVSPATVSEAIRGVAKKIDVDNAAAILGVGGDRQPGSIPALGVVRRIRALNTLGWMTEEVCEEAGLCSRFAADLFTKRRPNVSRASAEAIDGVYSRWCMRLPEMTPGRRRTRTLAQQRGYPPPLAWDSIDDPGEHPRGMGHRPRHLKDIRTSREYDEAVVVRILGGSYKVPASTAERRAVVARWPGTHNDLAAATGWKVERYREASSA